MRLKNRVAIVTGASSGIGRGICLEFAREGARVVVADIQEKPNQGIYHEQDTTTPTAEEVGKMGGEARFVQTDVADESAVWDLVDAAVDTFGGIDIIVNNAGVYIFADSQHLSVSDWDRLMGVNLCSVFLLTKFAIPHHDPVRGWVYNKHRLRTRLRQGLRPRLPARQGGGRQSDEGHGG